MKKLLLAICVFAITAITAQTSSVISYNDIPALKLPKLNLSQIQAEDITRDKQGLLYRIGVAQFTNITTENSGVWTNNTDGSRT